MNDKAVKVEPTNNFCVQARPKVAGGALVTTIILDTALLKDQGDDQSYERGDAI